MSVLIDLPKYIRFFLELPSFLEECISLEQARQTITDRLKQREENFLRLLKKGIFENRKSPYLSLFKLTGCQYADVQRMVKRDGLEAALQTIRQEGVFLSIEEFKGKAPVKRKGNYFQFKDRDFINPCISSFYRVKSGGTRSIGTRTEINLQFLNKRSVYYPLMIEMFGLKDSAIGIWFPGPPLGAGLLPFLQFAKSGKIAQRWFTPTKLYFTRKVGLKIMAYIMGRMKKEFPYPEFLSINECIKVVQWMAKLRGANKNLLFLTYPSLAVRICELAGEKKIDIAKVKFWLVGEPISEAKAGVIKSQGCSIIPVYAFMELGLLGFGCPRRQYPEAVHFVKDTVGLIQHKRYIPALDSHLNAFLFSSIMPSSPKILLNVENGDYGIIEKGGCGCLAEKAGLDIQIRDIQSFDKLNAEGMTLFVADFIPILENILPQRFGGGPLDYQLFEQESGNKTILSLIVSPKVGEVKEEEVIATVLAELKKGSRHTALMAEIWNQAGALKVKRAYPKFTKSSKVYPLFIDSHNTLSKKIKV